MASLPAGYRVRLSDEAVDSLRFRPPKPDLTVIVHEAALRAPWDKHTQVACIHAGSAVWLGALGEELLEVVEDTPDPTCRTACAGVLLRGSHLWDVVRPGSLVGEGVRRPLSTVYDGSDLRPWVVVGETSEGLLVGAPLNDTGNPKWWTPEIPQPAMKFPGNNKRAIVELAHIWTLPADLPREGEVLPVGVGPVSAAIAGYYGLQRV